MGEIHEAARYGNLQMLQKALQAGAIVDARDRHGRTPLFYACRWSYNDSLEVVKYLVEKARARVEYKSTNGWTPLITASHCGNLEVVKYLAEQAGANVNAKCKNQGWTPLMRASRDGHLEMVRYFVEQAGADVDAQDKDGKTALIHAVRWGKLDVIQSLIQDAGANVEAQDRRGRTPLLWAVIRRKQKVVHYLVAQAGANVEAMDDSFGDIGKTALLHACQREKQHFPMTCCLLEHGAANVNVQDDKQGRTPLHVVAQMGKQNMMEYLVEEQGAVKPVQDQNGDTPLQLAAEGCHWNAVRFLLRQE